MPELTCVSALAILNWAALGESALAFESLLPVIETETSLPPTLFSSSTANQ